MIDCYQTVEELKSELESEFEILCFVDLAELFIQHRSVFDLLDTIKKPKFAPNQRLIFYTSHRPDQHMIDHIQRAISAKFIPNWFVLVCCSFDISDELDKANQRFGYDDIKIKLKISHLHPTHDINESNFYHSDTLCGYAMGFIDISPNGNIAPCCKFKHPVGNINKEGLQGSFNGPAMIDLRQKMKDGERPESCDSCWQIEKYGGTSLRKSINIKLQSFLDQGWVDDPRIRSIDIAPGTTCNFSCRICGPWASSQIASEEAKYATDPAYKTRMIEWMKMGSFANEETVKLQLKDTYDSLQWLHVFGGEPLLQKSLGAMLEDLSANGRQDLMIEINTNCSIWRQDIVDLLSKFNHVEVSLSIDNIGKKFEIERGGRWDTVSENIHRWYLLRSPKFEVHTICTINIQNVLDLDDIYQFVSSFNDLPVRWHYLDRPSYLCIDYLTLPAKLAVKEKYKNHPDPELRAISKRMDLAGNSDGSEFRNRMLTLDSRRNQDFSKTHPEIWALMGGDFL